MWWDLVSSEISPKLLTSSEVLTIGQEIWRFSLSLETHFHLELAQVFESQSSQGRAKQRKNSWLKLTTTALVSKMSSKPKIGFDFVDIIHMSYWVTSLTVARVSPPVRVTIQHSASKLKFDWWSNGNSCQPNTSTWFSVMDKANFYQFYSMRRIKDLLRKSKIAKCSYFEVK